MAEEEEFHPQSESSSQPPPPSLLSTLGEEIVRIVTPVSVCIALVVALVTVLNSTSNDNNISADDSSPSDWAWWDWPDLKSAIFTSLVFVATITLLSFLLVLLFYFRFTAFLKSYMVFSSFVVLSLLGGQIALLLLAIYSLPLDVLTFCVLLLNFSVVGAAAVFRGPGVPLAITQGYLVVIAVLVAYWFTLLPEWTSWALLVSLAVYDIAAVLLPGGPLRLLVELAMSRDEDLPALVYEARPVGVRANSTLWRDVGSNPREVNLERENLEEVRLVVDRNDNESSPGTPLPTSELTAPLLEDGSDDDDNDLSGGIGLGASGAIKLGLGDFIFYSVLVGRVAMYDFMAVYACYLAIMAGLGITLLLLAFYQKALPALPFSIGLGVLFYVLTRIVLEEFVVQCSSNLVMF